MYAKEKMKKKSSEKKKKADLSLLVGYA